MDGQKDLRVSDLLGMQENCRKNIKASGAGRAGAGPPPAAVAGGGAGEVVSIVKKRKVEGIMEDPAVRSHFLEEMSDVLMYFTDVLLCLGVTAEEFSAAYEAKHQRNMRRDFS